MDRIVLRLSTIRSNYCRPDNVRIYSQTIFMDDSARTEHGSKQKIDKDYI